MGRICEVKRSLDVTNVAWKIWLKYYESCKFRNMPVILKIETLYYVIFVLKNCFMHYFTPNSCQFLGTYIPQKIVLWKCTTTPPKKPVLCQPQAQRSASPKLTSKFDINWHAFYFNKYFNSKMSPFLSRHLKRFFKAYVITKQN